MGRARVERSAGGVVVRRIEGVVHVLLIRDPYRNWGLPKGHLEEDEEAAAAAMREVREETGLHGLDLGPELDTIDWHFRLHGTLVHKFCAFYLMTSTSGQPVPEVEEGITECVWLPMEEALERISYDNARAVLGQAAALLARDDLPVGP
jgi:8-oxo-dGTP pyrophosphatase MutT (NUDIX family)